MLFWHTGATIAIARYAFRDDRMDLRMLVLGALLPDLIDTPIGLLFYDRLKGMRLATHGLVLASIVMVGVVLATRRGRPRKMWMPLAIGLLLHAVLDAMWLDPETLWWPFFGWGFSAAGPATRAEYVGGVIGDPRMWLGEAVGMVYLTYLWRAAGLAERVKRTALWRTGRIDLPIDGDATC